MRYNSNFWSFMEENLSKLDGKQPGTFEFSQQENAL